MFTGIVEEIGIVKALEKGQKFSRLTIGCHKILSDLKIGDSVSTNGVCLTATQVDKGVYHADVMAQTLRVSGLGTLKVGDAVNLERAMSAMGRFGGHIVSGHIDGVGKIVSIERESEAIWLNIEASEGVERLIMEKGSITIDGVSLTVAYLTPKGFKVSLIPHTAKETTLGYKKVGDSVNLENDMIGKFVERLMEKKEGGQSCLNLATLEAFLRD